MFQHSLTERTVPVSVLAKRFRRFRFRVRFLGKRFLRFRFPVPVRFLGHPANVYVPFPVPRPGSLDESQFFFRMEKVELTSKRNSQTGSGQKAKGSLNSARKAWVGRVHAKGVVLCERTCFCRI